ASIPEWNGDSYSNSKEIDSIQLLRGELQQLMTQYVGIFKTNEGLQIAENKIDTIYRKVNEIYNSHKLTYGLCELRNMVSIAYLITKQSQEISENKGVFYNNDYA
ncbi:L-aspartate oxidase, partial [Flavobacteriaceae bacterium]|nr:L-aspartate oxidase [Flavobacteriaceae bacterium]